MTRCECLCVLWAHAVASPCPQPHERTLCNLNLVFTLLCIPRTTLFGRNLLPRELSIWTAPWWSFTSSGMKNYFFFDSTPLVLWCHSKQKKKKTPLGRLRASVSPLSESGVNSSVNLIWDFCHLLSFPRELRQCCVTPLLVNSVRKPWNTITWVTGRLLWPVLKSPEHSLVPPSPGTFDTEKISAR